VVAAAQLRSGELVVDLGAGTGNLTIPLVEAGVRVIAVELHPRRAEELRRRLRRYDVVVVERDLSTFVPPGRPFRVVANPPFVQTALLLSMLGTARHLTRADLVLQRGVVRQLESGGRRSTRRLGARWVMDLSPDAFVPRPTVPVSLVTLRPQPRR
jgi:23S rRNA (adenine-N6)-dimethyltransferase